MFLIIVLILLLLILNILAMRWGYDSRDGLESREWERRQRSAWPPEMC